MPWSPLAASGHRSLRLDRERSRADEAGFHELDARRSSMRPIIRVLALGADCRRCDRVRAAGREERRVARLGAATRSDALRAARSDQRHQLQQARGRVALQDRQPRPATRLQPADDAADGERRAVLHRRRASERRRRQRRDRRDALDAPARRRTPRRAVVAPHVGTRRRLLDRRPRRRADLLRHDRLSARRPRREDRTSAARTSARTASSICGRTPIRRSISRPPTSPGTARRSSARNVVIVGAAHRAGSGAAQQGERRRATSAATTRGPASGSGSSTRFRGRASSATTPG